VTNLATSHPTPSYPFHPCIHPSSQPTSNKCQLWERPCKVHK
jgi:hypothetical protein